MIEKFVHHFNPETQIVPTFVGRLVLEDSETNIFSRKEPESIYSDFHRQIFTL